MDDVEELGQKLRAAAERRGLRIMDAVFPVEPSVVLRQETTTIDEALDLAEHVFAPFLGVSETRLEVSDFEDLREEGNDEAVSAPAELLQLLEQRDGQVDGVFVRWLGNGVVFLYIVVPAWRGEIDELREAWAEERAAYQVDEVRARHIRLTHLADRLEREPSYRAATPQARRSVGKSLLDPLLRHDEGAATVNYVLDQAGRLVRDNAASTYAKLVVLLEELVDELRKDSDWRAARRAPDRTAAVRRFLIEHADGYAPASAIVDDLRRSAER